MPHVLDYTNTSSRFHLVMERVNGPSAKEWLQLNAEWRGTPLKWPSAKKRLGQYASTEMDLLSRGALYRDLNPEHLIFQSNKALLIDHEETIITTAEQPNQWHLDSPRGTWETMAPEEFNGRGILTARTATYRVAVITHIALTGDLPFQRFPLRSQTNKWRQQHPPKIDRRLSKATSKVFAAALARQPTHRYKNPANFIRALTATLDPR